MCPILSYQNIATLTPFSGSDLYSGGLTWSIVLRCDDHTYFYVQWLRQGPVLLCACQDTQLCDYNFLAQGKSLPPEGIELGTFELQQPESATLATAPARRTCVTVRLKFAQFF